MQRDGAGGDTVAAELVAGGFQEITEPRPRDYQYIAEKVADRLMPLHHSEDEYDGRGREGIDSMARVHVYRHVIDGYDSWPRLQNHLKYTDGVLDALGLHTGPSRETLRRSWNQQFEPGTRHRLQQLALDIREEIGWGMDGVLLAMGVDDDSQSYPEFTEEGIRQRAKERAYDRIRPILTDVIDFERADNVSVPAEDLMDYAGWLARRQDYPESMETYVADEDLDAAPFDPETYRRAVRNKERERVETVDGDVKRLAPTDWSTQIVSEDGGTRGWHDTLENGIDAFVQQLKDDGVIDGPVPVCIDGSIRSWHKHPRGADETPDGVYREAYFDTNYGWKDISANAIIDGRSVVLANFSSVPGDKLFEAVKYLVDRATELLDVECFLADAAFANTDICRYIHHIGEYYNFRKVHRPPVKRWFEDISGRAAWTDYTMHSDIKSMEHDTTLYAVEKRGQIGVKKGEKRHDDHQQAGFDDFDFSGDAEGQLTFDDLADRDDEDIEYVAFITNRDIDSEGIDPKANPIGHNNENTVWGHAERYRKRWSIETTFRQVKYQFLPATRSRDLGTRRFVWMLAILLYNAWATVNLFVQRWAGHTFDEDETDPPVRAKVLLEELAKTDYG